MTDRQWLAMMVQLARLAKVIALTNTDVTKDAALAVITDEMDAEALLDPDTVPVKRPTAAVTRGVE